MFDWSGHGQLLARHTTEHYRAPVLNVLNQSINQSICIHHEYPMTLLKIANNSMIALLESLSSVREYQFIAWNVNRTTGKEVRQWLDWPDRLLRP